MPTPTPIAVGLSKGHQVEKRDTKAFGAEKPKSAIKPSLRKGTTSKRVKGIRELIRDVAGFAPYEKRVLDIIKAGGSNSEKRAYKFAKNRLGTHTRAIRKREELKALYGRMRARA